MRQRSCEKDLGDLNPVVRLGPRVLEVLPAAEVEKSGISQPEACSLTSNCFACLGKTNLFKK